MAELQDKILQLKKEHNAVILAHNYQRPDVQDIADFVGDSLELARQAAGTDADVIAFCGVHFMAETAAILSPDKTVIIPDEGAGCPMANMITASQLIARKKEMPGVPVVTYINSSAAVKAESDYCCTSSNGVRVVESVPGNDIIFVPDQYLGHFIQTQTGKNMTLWPGYCPTHMKILPEDILKQRELHPDARVVVHPECRPDVVAVADLATSTSGMLRYAQRDDVTELIVGTEVDIIHRMKKENPGKRFYPASDKAVCPNMKKITLEKLYFALESMSPVVTVLPDIAARARAAVDRMVAIS
jgi:quinolinate synthase